MNPDSLLHKPFTEEDYKSILLLKISLKYFGYKCEPVFYSRFNLLWGFRVDFGGSKLCFRLSGDYLSIREFIIDEKRGIRNSFIPVVRFLIITYLSVPSIKVVRADICKIPGKVDSPMSIERMLEYYSRIHHANSYKHDNNEGDQEDQKDAYWVEFVLDEVFNTQLEKQPKFIQRLVSKAKAKKESQVDWVQLVG